MIFFRKIFKKRPKFLDFIKLVFGYTSNEIRITLFLSDKSNQIFEDSSLINQKNIKELLSHLKQINDIEDIIINKPHTINENPLIKIIKIIIKHK